MDLLCVRYFPGYVHMHTGVMNSLYIYTIKVSSSDKNLEGVQQVSGLHVACKV